MSSSQLLTITESHGFRALLAAVAWIIARFAQRWARIAEPVVRNSQPARIGCWQQIVVAHLDRRSCDAVTQGTSALVRHHRDDATARMPAVCVIGRAALRQSSLFSGSPRLPSKQRGGR